MRRKNVWSSRINLGQILLNVQELERFPPSKGGHIEDWVRSIKLTGFIFLAIRMSRSQLKDEDRSCHDQFLLDSVPRCRVYSQEGGKQWKRGLLAGWSNDLTWTWRPFAFMSGRDDDGCQPNGLIGGLFALPWCCIISGSFIEDQK